MNFRRYVAIGDSTSEGLDDPDGRGGYVGWADRFAQHLANLQGEVEYANLAVRGLVTEQIRATQLARAVAMAPDVVTVVAGMNDLISPRFDLVQLEQHLEVMQRAFRVRGAEVLTFTLPSLREVMPAARLIETRLRGYNDLLRRLCARTGARLVDLAAHRVGSDPRMWSDDRLHANTVGHERVGRALAWRLGLPGFDASWADDLPVEPPPTLRMKLRSEAKWATTHLAPWVLRHARGRSSADGRVAKRPNVERVVRSLDWRS